MIDRPLPPRAAGEADSVARSLKNDRQQRRNDISTILISVRFKFSSMSKSRSQKFIRFVSKPGYISTGAVLLVSALSASAAHGAGIAWHGNLQQAAQQATAQHKPLLVMVKARWCGPCHNMLKQTFPNPALAARISSQFVPVLIDADEQASVAQAFGVTAMPTVLVMSPERKVMGRFTGFQSAAQLDARLAALTPSPMRQVAPMPLRPQMRSAGPPASGPSLALRPGSARQGAVRQSATSFLRRHAIASQPARPFAVGPGSARSVAQPGATDFVALDTLAAAKAFSAGGATPDIAVAAEPTPNPPD